MVAPTPFRTRYDLERASRAVVFKAAVDAEALTSTALLSYPQPDLAGDIVHAEGLDFARHMLAPRVDLEHGRTEIGRVAVGWANTGLAKADGYYTVRPVNLECDDGKTRPLPVATTHFDPSDRLQSQIFDFVAKGLLPAVSLEFEPDYSVAKSLGRSPLEPRDAYEFPRASVICYTLCEKPVCPSARVLKARYDPIAAVLSANRIGGEELHPTIKKAFADRVPGKPRLVTSGFQIPVEKAMDDTTPTPDATTTDPVATGDMPNNGITAFYTHVQRITDEIAWFRESLATTDNAKLMKDGQKCVEQLTAYAEKAKATVDKHDGELEAAKNKSDEEPAAAKDDYKPDMSQDEDGMLKGIPPARAVIVKACRGKSFTLAEVAKAQAEQDRLEAEAARKRADEERRAADELHARKQSELAAAREKFARAATLAQSA